MRRPRFGMMDRRTFLKRTAQMAAWWAAMGASGGLAGCGPAATEEPTVAPTQAPTEAPVEPTAVSTEAAPGGDTLVVVSWGGSYQDAQRQAFFAPFEEEYGVTILDSGDMDFAKLKAMAESGAMEWDVCDVGGYLMFEGANLGLLEAIDYSRFENLDEIIPEAMHEFGVTTIYYSEAIAYNTEVYPDGSHPKSFAEFWDVANVPGRRGLHNYVTPVLEEALMADGVPMGEVFPLDVDRAFASLDKIKGEIATWWDAGAQPPQLLADGELDVCTAWNGRIWSVQQEGVPVAMEWNEGVLEYDSWIIPKGAPHLELAQEFVAFASRADRQAELVQLLPYGPVNEKAFDFIPEEMAPFIPTYPDNRAVQLVKDYAWWGERLQDLIERFENWKLA